MISPCQVSILVISHIMVAGFWDFLYLQFSSQFISYPLQVSLLHLADITEEGVTFQVFFSFWNSCAQTLHNVIRLEHGYLLD